ncbi:hypothetical protein G6F65_016370 [Rhizopus arrhizus]|nr:hypothetical protein G6F65_016370 [Rhizopus arrhizus]
MRPLPPGQGQRHAAVGAAVQLHGHGARAGIQVGQQGVQRGAAQVQARFQRRIDPHVEPGFDGARHELHRHGVDHGPGHHTYQSESQRKPRRQTRAKLPAPDLARQPHRQRHHPDEQRQGENAVQHQQRVVVARKARGIARGPCQQTQQRQAAYGTHHQGQPEQQPHEGSFSLPLSPELAAVKHPFVEFAGVRHRPIADVADDAHGVVQRRHREGQFAHPRAPLPGQCVIDDPPRAGRIHQGLVEPPPAFPRHGEIGREIQGDAALGSVAQLLVQFEFDVGIDLEAAVAHDRIDPYDLRFSAICLAARHQGKQGRYQQQPKK